MIDLIPNWLLCLIGFVLVLYLTSKLILFRNYQRVKCIPGFTTFFYSPFYGNEHDMKQLLEKYGDPETKTMRMSMINGNDVLISDPAMLKEYFLKPNSFCKSNIHNMFNVFGENILSALNTQAWKRHHKVCAPAFSSTNLEYMCSVAVNSSELLFEKWDSSIKKDGTYLLEEEDFSNVTVDVIGKAGFNLDFGLFSHNEEGIQFRKATEHVMSVGFPLRRFFSRLPFLYHSFAWLTGADKSIHICSSMLDNIIKKRTCEVQERIAKSLTEDVERKRDILSLLVESNCFEKVLTDQELKSNALVMILAGYETTATLLRWVIYELSKRPTIQQQVFQEINETLKGCSPTYNDAPLLKYTNAVIQETLRLHSPVVSIVKEATKTVQLGKFTIPKGTLVNAIVSGVHTLNSNWTQPEQFIPDRFLDPKIRESIQNDFSWIPFSAGQRRCIGYKFAELEACMILTKMVQQYEFTLLNDEKVDPVVSRPGITCKASKNLKVQVSKRK